MQIDHYHLKNVLPERKYSSNTKENNQFLKDINRLTDLCWIIIRWFKKQPPSREK